MLEQKIDNWTFRYIQLKADVIVMQDCATNLWACNLAIAVMQSPEQILPNDLFKAVKTELLKSGFYSWGIIADGEVIDISGVKIVQPFEVEGVPDGALMTISVDYRLLAQF